MLMKKENLDLQLQFQLKELKTEAKTAFRDYIRDSCALLKKG